MFSIVVSVEISNLAMWKHKIESHHVRVRNVAVGFKKGRFRKLGRDLKN